MYFIITLITIYILSCIAVALWDKMVSGTEIISWVDNSQIFFPIYNTIIAIQLWNKFNPFK